MKIRVTILTHPDPDYDVEFLFKTANEAFEFMNLTLSHGYTIKVERLNEDNG